MKNFRRIFVSTLALLLCFCLAPQAVLAEDNSKLLESARLFTQKGYIDRAVAVYDGILAKSPNDFTVLEARGNTLFSDGRWGMTIPAMQKLVAINPRYQHGFVLLAISYARLQNYKQAAVAYDKAIALGGPETGTAHRGKALLLMQLEQLESARKEIALAIINDKPFPQLAGENTNAAMAIERHAVMLPPATFASAAVPELVQAEALLGAGQGTRSLELLERVLAAHPNNARAHVLKGRIFFDAIESEKAIAEYSRAIALVPTYQYGYIALAKCYFQLERFGDALAQVDHAIKLGGPTDAVAHEEKGCILVKMGRALDGRVEIDKALKIHKSNFDIYEDLYDRAEADRALRDYPALIVDIGKRLQINDTNSADWQARGEAYLAAGKLDKALADLGYTLVLAPGNRAALKGLIEIYKKKGDKARVNEFQKRLKEVDESY
ncbi:MAG: tetratricopeptide repeat protein [Cyanobacteria bacterium REEB67]|nr:tetratricopeptide repeat protein [Cyanobacteria bacterium REEB67]